MCQLCKTKPVYEFTNQRKLCKTCFVQWFQKKVLYTIRRFKMISKNDVVGFENSGIHQVGPEEGCIPRRDENFFEAPKNIQKNIFTKDNFREVVLEDVLKMFAERAIIELAPSHRDDLQGQRPQAYPEESSAKILTKGIKLPTNTLRVYTKEVREPFQGPEKSFSTQKVYPERKNFSTRGKILTKGKKLDKIAIASNTDLEADKIIHFLIKGNVKDLKNVAPVNNKIIKPLYLFLDKEVLLYAKLRNLKFKKIKEDTQGCTPRRCENFSEAPKNIQENIFTRGNKISKFVDELEKKHPEVKRAIVNSCLKLQS